MASRRELILARLYEIVSALPGIESSGRNLDRVADTKLPYGAVFDGDEEAFENLRARGMAPNAMFMTPNVVVSLGEVPENVGTLSNEWLAKVQKAVLSDQELQDLCGGREGTQGRIVHGGPQYIACTTSLSEGRTAEVNISVHFSIGYPFQPREL